MQKFQAEMQASRDELHKKWGDLANKMGTLVEDLVVPNIEPIVEKYFGMEEEADIRMVRQKRRHFKDRSKSREFDVVAIYQEHVFLNETKSKPKAADIDAFIKVKQEFFDFFPECSGKELILIFAALYVDESVIKYASKKGVYVLATKGNTMDILNFKEI